jgi:hypothetical protein
MAKFYYHKLPAGSKIPGYKNHAKELVVVWSLLKFLESNGHAPIKVFDGEENVMVRSAEEAFENAVAVEDAYVWFKDANGKKNCVRFIFGNDWSEVIADHSDRENDEFPKFMDAVYDYLNSDAPCIPSVSKEV